MLVSSCYFWNMPGTLWSPFQEWLLLDTPMANSFIPSCLCSDLTFLMKIILITLKLQSSPPCNLSEFSLNFSEFFFWFHLLFYFFFYSNYFPLIKVKYTLLLNAISIGTWILFCSFMERGQVSGTIIARVWCSTNFELIS